MPARGRRYLVILAILAGLAGLYAAVGFLVVPRWIRPEVTGLAARDFGRKLSLGEVRFNPFTWTLELGDVSLPDANGRPMITFRRLEVALGASSVLRLAPTLTYIDLDGPHVSAVVRRDGKLNLADLMKPAAARPEAGTRTTGSGASLKLIVDRLTVENGSATYEDDSRATPFRLDLDRIAFQLLDFTTAGSTPGSYHLTAAIRQGGRLDWQGTVRAQPISLRGTLEVDSLSARTVGEYLGAVLPDEISQGTITLQGRFAVAGAAGASGGRGVTMTIDVPRAQVSGLGVRPRKATSDYVRLERFTLANTHIDLERRSIRVGEILLAGPDIRAWLDRGGKLNLLDLLGPVAPARGPVWHISAPDIRIEDARVSLEDRAVQPAARLTLARLSGRITGYGSSPGSRIQVSLQAAVNGKGQLRLTAAGTLQPEVLSAKVTLRRIGLRALQPYLSEYSALTLKSGSLDSTLEIVQGAGGRLSATGRIDIADLRTVDDALKRDFVKWQSLHIVGFRYVSRPASLRIKRIVAVAPYARIIIEPSHTLNLSEALHPRGAAATLPAVKPPQAKTAPAAGQPGPSAPPAMTMTIGLVRIANGTADFADLSIKPRFATGIENLHGVVTGLSSVPASRARIDLRGKVNRRAPVQITGVANFLSSSIYADIRMEFRGLELTRMSPYAVRFAGYEIASGTLDAHLHYVVDAGRLDADHRLVINQLQLGKRIESPHAIKLPLRLAVALLKDRNGVIRIGLPVTGSLSNPQFSLGPLIAKALLHVLKKAVTAPFALLGRLFGGGPDMDRIDFAPGSAALPPGARARAAALAKALAQRPQLQLQVAAVFAPDVDRPALARRRLREELLALARSGAGARSRHGGAKRGGQGSPPPAGPEALELPAEHYRLLRAAYRNTFGPKAPLPAAARKAPPFEPAIRALRSALLERIRISAADLQALGERRAQAIRAAILSAGGIAAARVEITAARPRLAAAGKVVVQLGLK